jgi:SsrA-binding protein
MMAKKDKNQKFAGDGTIVVGNKKARFQYQVIDKMETGIALVGNEVKSLRLSRGSLVDAYARIKNGEVWLNEMFIDPYFMGSRYQTVDPRRPRKLLLHRNEINRLERKLEQPGHTLVPLSVYFKKGRAKVELALVKGKQQHDKSRAIKERDQKRDLDRIKKQYNVG